MDVQHARFVFEVLRAGDRVAAQLQPAPTDAPAAVAAPRAPSMRHTCARLLHALAARLERATPHPA